MSVLSVRLRVWASNWLLRSPRLYSAWRWAERVRYCHHNARVIADFEHRMSLLLEKATGGALSKPYYDWPTMSAWVDDFLTRERNEAFAEGEALDAPRSSSSDRGT